MSEMAEQRKISIRFYNDHEVRAVWDDAQSKWWFSVLDIVGAINGQADYTRTRNYWKYLKGKLRKQNSEVVSVTNQLKLLAPDGKRRLTDVLDYDGVMRLAQNIPNTNAAPSYTGSPATARASTARAATRLTPCGRAD